MASTGRDRFEERAGAIGIALIVTVVVAVGAVIVSRSHTSTPPPAAASTAAVAPLPLRQPLRPTELLHGDAAGFDSGTGGWTSSDATLTVSSASPESGSGALQAVLTDPAGGQLSLWSPEVRAKPHFRYVGSADDQAVTASRSAELQLRFLDSSGKVTDTEVGQLATDTVGQWSALSPVAAISPKGTAKVQLGIVFPVAGAGATHLIDAASLAQTPGGSARVVGPLTTRGNQILDGRGQPLILRGLQRFGLEGGTKTPLPTNAEIGQLKLWGANEVRISLGEQKWVATNCHYEPNYPQVVDRVVHWVTSRGMVALLNLHYATNGDCGPPGLTDMADSPGAITFWQEVASRYKDNPLVAFDLFNEPHVPESTWLYGGTFDASGHKVEAAGMQQLYDTVRSTGATNLVVVSGLDYADHPPTQLVEGTDIAYGAHAYQCTSGPPPGCTVPRPFDAGVPLHHWLGFSKTHPVIVTEFGFPDHGVDGTYNANVIAYCEQHHWSWSGFAWDGGTDGLFDLVQAHPASDGSTIEPNFAGMPLVGGFAMNRPSPHPYAEPSPTPSASPHRSHRPARHRSASPAVTPSTSPPAQPATTPSASATTSSTPTRRKTTHPTSSTPHSSATPSATTSPTGSPGRTLSPLPHPPR